MLFAALPKFAPIDETVTTPYHPHVTPFTQLTDESAKFARIRKISDAVATSMSDS